VGDPADEVIYTEHQPVGWWVWVLMGALELLVACGGLCNWADAGDPLPLLLGLFALPLALTPVAVLLAGGIEVCVSRKHVSVRFNRWPLNGRIPVSAVGTCQRAGCGVGSRLCHTRREFRRTLNTWVAVGGLQVLLASRSRAVVLGLAFDGARVIIPSRDPHALCEALGRLGVKVLPEPAELE
jgi:hypothetical protein